MTLTVNSIGDNPQQPGITADAYIPDQLIAGPLQLVSDTVTIVSGAGILQRGTLLGKITASGKYKTALSASADGSQTPVAILEDYVDASAADQTAGIYLMGEFNTNAMTFGTGITAASSKDALRALGIFLKNAVSADDPT